jgi:hypothetical protein
MSGHLQFGLSQDVKRIYKKFAPHSKILSSFQDSCLTKENLVVLADKDTGPAILEAVRQTAMDRAWTGPAVRFDGRMD